MAAAGALVVGNVVRLIIGAGGLGDRSAAVMATLLGLAVWTATMLLGTPRTAFYSVASLMVLLDLAALPARTTVEFDDREALFRTDQVVLARTTAQNVGAPVLTVLVEPIFAGAQPVFGLAADVGGAALAWDCPFGRGIQRVVLPLPGSSVTSGAVDVGLRLTGTPSREGDYLLVYASSARGGPLVSLVDAAEAPANGVRCSAR